jgi:conjugative relaxase-like TrwC/TraI family protein
VVAFRGNREEVAAVLSSAKIGTSSWRYYTDSVACRPTEYYLGVGEAPGRWHGRGLAELGLEPGGRVTEQQLEALFARALNPSTGRRLGRAWRADGVTGFDLCFSEPKSISALWALGNTDVAAAAMAAHRAAVQASLGYLDTHAGLSRRGTDGTEQIGTAGLAVALFDHRTSRAGDPQLHTHALVVNKVRCTDGTWRALDGTELYHHKKSAGMIYQTALRNELSQRLEVVFERVNEHGQAEISGVPKDLLKLWSKRTAHIDADATPKIAEYETALGRSLTKAERASVVKAAVLKTRPGKEHPELSALHELWTSEAGSAGHSTETLLRSVRAAASDQPATAALDDAREAELLLDAVRAAGQTRAVFSRADVAGQIAARLPTTGLTAAEAVARVEELTDAALRTTEAVSVGEHPQGVTPRASDSRWASAQVLTAEARILSLAGRGSHGGYGQVPNRQLNAILRDPAVLERGLDASQYAAVLRLTGDGDFLTVLTAPAGAGKTHTLGAATAAWQAAGYRVVGLAPSARAAAELATATGGRTDTLAKWLHTHDRAGQLPADQQAWARVDDRTVLLIDEASMASTLDLDRLTTLAAWSAAKVVLVGDPGQIGVINGPGGMLAALARADHAVELTGIHRFTQSWEKDASLRLRDGDPSVLATYQAEGRVHPCPDSDHALDAVFAHWTQARADGLDALMMARTRVDVDALNTRARAAAHADGDSHGPAVRIGERDWHAADLLRTRRNDRQLPVGDGHVRNGDRYRVLNPDGPGGGLIVEDLAGRGRTVLPAGYVAEHAEYGWASTIDAAQGATSDVGIVLVRPGLDREHLYVAMTRGRDANHAYIAPDPATDPEHHHSPPPRPGLRERQRTPADRATDVLAAALATSGAQDAAHTALHTARARVAEQTRREAERQAAAEREALRQAARAVPPEHAATAALLEQRRAELQQLKNDQSRRWQLVHRAQDELAALPCWARGRRQAFTDTISEHQTALARPIPAQLTDEIERLTRQVERDTRDRTDRINEVETQRLGRALFTRPAGELSRPRPVSVIGTAGRRGQRDRFEHDLGPQRGDDFGLSR